LQIISYKTKIYFLLDSSVGQAHEIGDGVQRSLYGKHKLSNLMLTLANL